MTDANGNVAVYAYNTDNTLASTTYTPGTGIAATPSVSFTYDTPYKRVLTMTDGTGTTTYSYNPITGSVTTGAGRLAGISVPISGSSAAVTYSYDALERVVGRGVDASTTNANNVSATFDALGRLSNLTNALGAFGYTYVDQTNRLSEVTYPNWQKIDYSYFDNMGDQRLKEIKNYVWGVVSNTPLSDFQYTYNAVGTIATWQQQTDGNTPTQYALGYDNADQLTSAVQTNTSTSATVSSNAYNYDPAGNRLAETTLSGITGGQFNALNQLTGLGSTTGQTIGGNTSASVSNVTVDAFPATISNATNFSANVPLPNGTNVVSVVAQPISATTPVTTQRVQVVTSGTAPNILTYDRNGNITTDESGNSYSWDGLNRLISITYPSGASSNFAYDAFSRRTQIVEKNSSGTNISTKNYLWTGTSIIEERDAGNEVTKRFFSQGEQQSGTAYYYTYDHLGSTREVVDSSDTIQARYSYDPYGATTLVQGTNVATFQFTGMYAHQTSGFQLTLFRAYDPNTGRWLNRDPIAEAGGLGLYGYCGDDPIDDSDPAGLVSNTYYNNQGVMVHSETPVPGEGGVHIQLGNSKWQFNTITGRFEPPSNKVLVNLFNNDPRFLRGINNAINRVNANGGFCARYGGGQGAFNGTRLFEGGSVMGLLMNEGYIGLRQDLHLLYLILSGDEQGAESYNQQVIKQSGIFGPDPDEIY